MSTSRTSIDPLKVGDQCPATKTWYRTPTDIIRKLSTTEGGIYIAAAPLLVSQCGVKTIPIKDDRDNIFQPFQGDFYSDPQECKKNPNKVNVQALSNKNIPDDLIDTIYIVVRQAESPEKKVGTALANFFLSSQEAQQALEQTGYLRIPPEEQQK